MIWGEVGGYVLAGGLSFRMGTDKALLSVRGELLGRRVARAVDQAVGSAVIVGDPGRHSGLGYPVISDTFRGCGPLGGIHAALTHTEFEWNLIAACDLPGVDGDGLSGLLNRIAKVRAAQDTHDVWMPSLHGVPQPLCAMYRRGVLPVVEGALAAGRFKITDALQAVSVGVFASDEERLFANCNTPEEWQNWVSA